MSFTTAFTQDLNQGSSDRKAICSDSVASILFSTTIFRSSIDQTEQVSRLMLIIFTKFSDSVGREP